MKRSIGIFLSVFLLSGSIFSFSSCGEEPTGEGEVDFSNYTSVSDVRADDYFGTSSTVLVYYDKSADGELEKAQALLDEVDDYISEVESNLNPDKAGSDVARFNAAQPGTELTVSEMTYRVIEETQALYEETDGAYNPAVSMLVDLWGFSTRVMSASYQASEKYDRDDPSSALPDETYIEAFQTLCAYGDIGLREEDGVFYVIKPDASVTVDGVTYSMKIDLGGYGKGYAADGAADILQNGGFSYGYVSLGGSSLKLLKCPSNETQSGVPFDWSIKVTYPTQYGAFWGEWFAQLYGQDVGISTSGDYERFYVYDGVTYCHIIDAATGAPIRTGICSANIVGGSAAENDALTTALCVMGVEKAISFVNEYLTDRKVSFVYRNDEEQRFEVYTNATDEQFSIQDGYEELFQIFGIGDGNGKITVK